MLPDRAQIFMSAIEDFEYKERKINWWDNVYGFDMSCIKKLATVEPLVDMVNPDQIVTDFSEMVDIDCNTCTVADLQFKVPFKITAQRDDYIHGERCRYSGAAQRGSSSPLPPSPTFRGRRPTPFSSLFSPAQKHRCLHDILSG